jgi:hypothetical protein
MIDFSITDNQTKQTISYSLPTSWDDVTWKQYEDYTLLNELDWGDDYAKTEAQLSVLASIPIEKIQEIGFQMVVELVKHLNFLKQAPTAYPKAYVEVGGEIYYAQKLESFGEIIAHNKVSSRENMTFNQKLPYILAISLRKKVTKIEEKVSTKWYKKPFGLKETSTV